MAQRILVADDEKEIADLVEVYLKNEGYEVSKCYSGKAVLERLEQEPCDLALLDVMMPEEDGFSLCRKIRERFQFPVIMLTAKTEPVDRITGLSLGADDYVTKPFHPLELVARVKAQLRRYTKYDSPQGSSESETPDFLELDGLRIDRKNHRCALDGKELELTPLEFSILWYLCENRGRAVSSEELYEAVWGERYLDGNNTVMVHIRHLREKMHEPVRKPRFIKTVWGVGYRVE